MTTALTRAEAPVVRTVLGDVPASELGTCYAHEHLILDANAPSITPEITLESVDDAAAELAPCTAAGVRTVVDAMPADAGRNPTKLIAVSQAAGVHLVATTGLHHARYYPKDHWAESWDLEAMAGLFEREIVLGIDTLPLDCPSTSRSTARAGLVKAAGSESGPSPRDRRVFAAAAEAARRTGTALMTHCEHGLGGLEQLELLRGLGFPLKRVVLSHTDKVADSGYHRELLAAGANVVYDQGLRTPEQSLELLERAVAEGHTDQLLLGTDGARRSLWTVLGGGPGLAALRTSFHERLTTRIGAELAGRLWVANPARVLALRP